GRGPCASAPPSRARAPGGRRRGGRGRGTAARRRARRRRGRRVSRGAGAFGGRLGGGEGAHGRGVLGAGPARVSVEVTPGAGAPPGGRGGGGGGKGLCAGGRGGYDNPGAPCPPTTSRSLPMRLIRQFVLAGAVLAGGAGLAPLGAPPPKDPTVPPADFAALHK